ncbi:MAG: hypothetical protein EA422_03650 [Gemmatimonadales bacterium]|nr:MAG: hypothetical protein EA422_03650 [Gemmatimonadales bacterium]
MRTRGDEVRGSGGERFRSRGILSAPLWLLVLAGTALPLTAQTPGDPIRVGDEIRFLVQEREDLSAVRTVAPDGSLLVPGTEGIWLPAAGRSLEAVQNAVATVLRSLYGELEVELELVQPEESPTDALPDPQGDDPDTTPVGPEQERMDPPTPVGPTPSGPPGFTPGGTLARGLLIPGLGQLHTQRPAMGLLVLAGAGVGVFLASRSELTDERRTFSGPFGEPEYQSVVRVETYPQRELGIGLAAVALLGGALEAFTYARRQSDAGVGSRASVRAVPSAAHSSSGPLTLRIDLPMGESPRR